MHVYCILREPVILSVAKDLFSYCPMHAHCLQSPKRPDY